MSEQYEVTRKVKNVNESNALEKTITISAGQEIKLNESIPDNGTTTVTLNLDQSAMKLLYIETDQACSLDTDGVSQAAIPVQQNKAIEWDEDSGLTNPITEDCTELHVTVADLSGVNVGLKLRALQDPTP